MQIGKKQKEIASEAGISDSFYSGILSRDRRASPEVAARLERVTGIDRRSWLWPDEFHNPLLHKKSEPEEAT